MSHSNSFQLLFISAIIAGSVFLANAQDSLLSSSPKKYSKANYLVPASLLTAGVIWNKGDRKSAFRNTIRERFDVPDKRWDDYAQHLPILILYAGDLIGGLPKKEVGDQTKFLIVSQIATMGITYALKLGIDAKRPHGGGRSFPSGHTSYAFAGATVLFFSYKDHNKWLAYSGYLPAAFTGFYRLLRDKHWISDVLVGAGLGMLIPALLHEISWLQPARSRTSHSSINYQFGMSSGGISLTLTF